MISLLIKCYLSSSKRSIGSYLPKTRCIGAIDEQIRSSDRHRLIARVIHVSYEIHMLDFRFGKPY